MRGVDPRLSGSLSEPIDLTDPDNLKKLFRARVLIKLNDKGWNQSELGRRSGVSRDQLSTYLRDPPRSLPGHSTVLKIAQALGCQPIDLIPTYFPGTITPTAPVEIVNNEAGDFLVKINVPLPLRAVTELMQLVERYLPEGGVAKTVQAG